MNSGWVGRLTWASFIAMLCLSGCDVGAQTSLPPTLEPGAAESPDPTQTGPTFPVPTTYQCEETLVLEWPVIESVTPDPASPGSIVEVVGHGGVIRCGNAYDESSRDFNVFLDEQRIGTINCYVNHCQGEVQLPAGLEPGDYSLDVSPQESYVLKVQ